MIQNPSANAGDTGHVGLIPGLGRFPGEGNGNPEVFLMSLCGQYSSTFFLPFNFIYLILAVLGLPCCLGFSLAVASGGLLSSFTAWAYCRDFSCWGGQALEFTGFGNCGTRAQQSVAPRL